MSGVGAFSLISCIHIFKADFIERLKLSLVFVIPQRSTCGLLVVFSLSFSQDFLSFLEKAKTSKC